MKKAHKLFNTLLEYRERKKIMSDVLKAIDEYVEEQIKKKLENEKRTIETRNS
tara:strand:+ start:45 stop:203 length:159 start_codon:yes stop_codon:yes gene_type:complete